VVAPDAVNETLAPGHIAGEFGVIVITGFGFTVTTALAVPEQPPVVPVTVYVVVAAGETMMGEPVWVVFHI
jgi:hypothetical protein